MPTPDRRSPLPIALAAMLVFACGYRSALDPGTARSVDEPTRSQSRASVALLVLRSDSPEPWLDRIVMDAFRREMGQRARLRFVDAPAGADLKIRGRILPLDVSSRSFSSFVAALEYSLTLQLDLEIELESGDRIQLDSSMLSETESYLASPDIEVTRTNRLEALRRMSDLLASRVADTIELIERPIPQADPEVGG